MGQIEARPRIRDLGVEIGVIAAGPLNAILMQLLTSQASKSVKSPSFEGRASAPALPRSFLTGAICSERRFQEQSS
jgi:hypothetical protein